MRIFILVILLFSLSFCQAQQHAQQKIEVKIKQPNFEWQQGPRILIDNTHNNFHQRTGRFAPFATLTEKDGYQVGDFGKTSKLDDADILVISNAIHEKNVGNWVQPIHSAFNKNEIEEIRHWVYDGGSLLLIADHMPFAGAAKELASALGLFIMMGLLD